MEEGLAEAIDDGKIGPRDDPKIRGKVLVDDFGWDKELAKKIWAFGAHRRALTLATASLTQLRSRRILPGTSSCCALRCELLQPLNPSQTVNTEHPSIFSFGDAGWLDMFSLHRDARQCTSVRAGSYVRSHEVY